MTPNDDRLVMANRANNVPRVAAEETTPPMLTGETVCVVDVQQNGSVRRADDRPVHTVRAGGQHHGVVVAHFDPGWARRASELPTGSITTKDHHSLVVPYNRTGQARVAQNEPGTTISTRDRLALIVPLSDGNVPAIADREPISTVTQVAKQSVLWADETIDACLFRMFGLGEIAGSMVMRNHHTTGGLYEVKGNKREVMAQYGNSVTPPAMAWIVGQLMEVIPYGVFVDLFCGAGGSALGAELAGAKLALGLNHWDRAVETHAVNFQHADHDCEDISSLTTAQIRRYVQHAQADGLIGGAECTNHTNAKGAKRIKPQAASLFEDGPAGDAEQEKSRATMWDIVRWAEQAMLVGKPFKWIAVENVVEAFNWGANDDGGLFNAWLMALENLGYEYELVWLNSMFAPPAPDAAPQSRDRMYPVFWLKGARRPNLRVQPPAWCPHCEQIVLGVQAFKRLDRRPWGRYGAQYLYHCPECRKPAIPGAFPAATIIDDSIPMLPIGEQRAKKCKQCGRRHPVACSTRGRIRRGLHKLENEPFAIRLTHEGAPKPLTLPLVTLTARHDMAMVMPVAGNTFERTAGNRARDSRTRPLDTVHGTLDRAIVVPSGGAWADAPTLGREPVPTVTSRESRTIVVPPSGDVAGRSASDAPAPTQTTTTRASVVKPPETLT